MWNVCEKSAKASMRNIAERLLQARSLLVVTHGRPDGDGLGSLAALVSAAQAAGKRARGFVPGPWPAKYDFLFPTDRPETQGEAFGALADESDLIAIVDTAAFAQLDGLEEALRARRDKVVVIDHHATSDDVGSLQWADSSAAAGGVMVLELLEALGWAVEPVAEALMAAITTDTGWLRFANTDARCLRAVARLVEAGVRPDRLYRKVYQTDRPQRLELMRRMLGTLELHCEGKLASMSLTLADFQASGARPDETENLVNEALRLDSVDTVILLVENESCVRANLRSRDVVDVAAIARQFGGGGHRRAAGLRANEAIEPLKARLVAACAKALARA
jgi:bifunctional oligoribonuclease and PAP phosphatase NrnA